MGTEARNADIRVLGPFEVAVGGGVLELGGPRLRGVLAMLVAGAGRVVSVSSLVDGLWVGHAPPDADRTVRTYVSRLRKALLPAAGDATAGEPILTRPPGYVLRLDPEAVDAGRFARLAAAGRQALEAGQPAAASERLAAALGLWRGEAYGEFGDTPSLRAEGARLEGLRVTALEDRIDADLATGLGGELVAELEGLLARHPGHERLWGHLMRALYRAGRQAEALRAFQRARDVLVEESGLEPSPGLVEIHRQVLAQDPRLLAARPAAQGGLTQGGLTQGGSAGSPGTRPAQLPPAVRAFAGRAAELAALDAVLPGTDGSEPATLVVAAVSGPAGIGKTALAVHWAHRVAGRFPDGQVYVNLRGFDPAGAALDPAEAVRGFLDAFGVPASQIPAGLDARTALYRSIVAGKRVLVVLDNARDPEQVRPLLPGSPGCLAIVTSRNQLTPLVVTEGAHPLTLNLLSTGDAGDLLARRLGPDRVAAEPEAVAEVITRCARLPLALAIAAAHAATHPDHPLACLAAELREATGGLDAFHGGDAATDVRSVFSWSYRTLTSEAAGLFRLLGLHPGPDLSTAAAASLAGAPVPAARRLLAELTRAHLLTEPTPGRYTFHDLLRAYAAELTAGHDSDRARRAALHRILDHYLHTADAAASLRYPHRDPFDVGAPCPGVTVQNLADSAAALAWFSTEHAVLLGAVELAARTGFDAHIWQLARNLVAVLDGRGHWNDVLAIERAAVAAATRLADRPAQADAHRHLAGAYLRLGRVQEADTDLRRALDLYQAIGDPTGQAHCHYYLAVLRDGQHRYPQALRHAYRALELYRTCGHRVGQAQTLNAIGWCHAQLGDYQQALTRCEQALALQQEIGDRASEADTLDSIGYAHHHLGQYTPAIACYQQALTRHRKLGDRYREAETLNHLAETHHAAGNPLAARDDWRHALATLDELGHPDAELVRGKLHSLDEAAWIMPAASAYRRGS